MLIHIVMFRRKPDVARDATVESEFSVGLKGLPERIPLIRRWKLSANELDRPTCWDFVLESAFDSEADLDQYLKHPAHVAIVGHLRYYFDWAAVDYTEAA